MDLLTKLFDGQIFLSARVVPYVAKDKVILLSDDGNNVYTGKEFVVILRFLGEPLNIPGLVNEALSENMQPEERKAQILMASNDGDPNELAKLLHALDYWVHKSVIEVNEADELTPECKARPKREVSSQAYFLLANADIKNRPRQNNFVSWLSALPESYADSLKCSDFADKRLRILVVDDYAHPGLGKVCDEFLRDGMPILFVEAIGKKKKIGPILRPRSDDQSNICWSCLSHRLNKNRPVTRWLEVQFESAYIPIPKYVDKQQTTALLDALSELVHTHYTCLENHILEWCGPGLPIKKHMILPLPGCRQCRLGQTGLDTSPIELDWKECVKSRQGGLRIQDPEVTLSELEQLVSPLSGDFTHLQKIGVGGHTFVSGFYVESFKADINQASFCQLTLGKGVNQVQAQVSALGEALERNCAQYASLSFEQAGLSEEPCKTDHRIIFAAEADLGERFYRPGSLACFSATQYEYYCTAEGKADRQAVRAYQHTDTLHWIKTWSLLKNEAVYIPLTYCYTNTPFLHDEEICRWNSNGCAVGKSVDEAILQGLLEVIERDAVAIWWYNKRVVNEIGERGEVDGTWAYWFLDVTNDFAIPVVVAVAQNQETEEIRLGFGCHLSYQLACERAYTELVQIINVGENGPKGFNFTHLVLERFLLPSTDMQALRATNAEPGRDNYGVESLAEAVQHCLERAKVLGLDVLVHRYRRDDLPLRAVKVVVPGACHIWPQLGNERLVQNNLINDHFNSHALFM